MLKDIISVVENSKVMHSIATAAVNNKRYWRDFLQVNEDYKKTLNEQEYNRFLEKSQLDCEINIEQYLQFSSEVTVVDYIIRNYTEFTNEPKYNGKKNPECSFKYEGRTVNVEVKCPNYAKRREQENSNSVKVYAAERFQNKVDYDEAKDFIELGTKDGCRLQTIDRMDNKLKDYLISAHKKFPISNLSNFNVLVIAVDIIQDMDEWYSYLFSENGAFTNKTFIKEDYNNVDAVLLTNVQHGHMGAGIDLDLNCWQLENYSSLLFLDPRKQVVNALAEYYENVALNLFGGLTRNFLSFMFKLDQNNAVRNSNIIEDDLDENKKNILFNYLYIEDKMIDLQIISKWVESLSK